MSDIESFNHEVTTELAGLIPEEVRGDPERLEDWVNRALEILNEGDAHILQNESWGKRKLAYEIDKFNKAYYFYLQFIAKPGLTHEIERVFRLTDDCLRYQTIRLEDGIDPDHLERYPVLTDGDDEKPETEEEVA